jgi:5-(carboxyamino)imidazole ribonucleotide synthase
VKPVLPGSAIGVLGGGQLGRMFAIAARRMGYRVHTLSPDTDTPAGQVSDVEVAAEYEDLDAVREFARNVSVVTFEFENVPVATANAVAEIVPVRPGGDVLHTTQQRIREKTFLKNSGFPVTRFETITSSDELHRAVAAIGCPSILKTADFGYDGKGQVSIKSPADAAQAWKSIGERPAILEAFVEFELELSVVSARGVDSEYRHYGALENHHRNHILDFTVAPGRVAPQIARNAVELARAVVEKLDAVGVICVEMFLCRDGRLLVNEIAPRPHNSGHFTIDACQTSQFEQQLRAVCGLPLGSAAQHTPAAMANLLGDLWTPGEPDWVAVCARDNVKLHLYGKNQARPGRKMGHLTALGVNSALQDALAAREALVRRP